MSAYVSMYVMVVAFVGGRISMWSTGIRSVFCINKVPSSVLMPEGTVVVEEKWAISVDCSKPLDDFEYAACKVNSHQYILLTELKNVLLIIQFPFTLDPFQKHAVYHLEKHENVFVAAHTSAGKTVVAEYAIALSRDHHTK